MLEEGGHYKCHATRTGSGEHGRGIQDCSESVPLLLYGERVHIPGLYYRSGSQISTRLFRWRGDYAFFSKLMPSLDLLEKVLDVKKENSALTPLVRCSVEGIKRKKAQERGMVKKATGYSWQIFVDLIQKEVMPHLDNPGYINAFHFRSLVRAAVPICPGSVTL
jgi:hypothetical protein